MHEGLNNTMGVGWVIPLKKIADTGSMIIPG